MTAEEIIQGLGGDSVVSKETGWAVSTVNSMRRFNSIPEWRRAKLLELAGKRGFPLAATDFPAKDDRIVPVRRQAA